MLPTPSKRGNLPKWPPLAPRSNFEGDKLHLNLLKKPQISKSSSFVIHIAHYGKVTNFQEFETWPKWSWNWKISKFSLVALPDEGTIHMSKWPSKCCPIDFKFSQDYMVILFKSVWFGFPENRVDTWQNFSALVLEMPEIRMWRFERLGVNVGCIANAGACQEHIPSVNLKGILRALQMQQTCLTQMFPHMLCEAC